MSIRADLVEALAPIAPPCFSTRMSWVEYLKSAAESGGTDKAQHPTPLLSKRGDEPRFNYDFNFCADCDMAHATRMTARDMCKPLHLRILGLNRKVIPIAVVKPTPAQVTPTQEVACVI